MLEFCPEVLTIDDEFVTKKVCSFIRQQVSTQKRRGLVVGLSGGIDSALCAALCVRAVGAENVLGLILPEKESNPMSVEYALAHASKLGIKTEQVDITQSIESFGTYDLRDSAVRKLFPDFTSGCRFKIVLPPDLLARDTYNFYTLIVEDADGHQRSTRLDNATFRQIVAATNLKQRTRMLYLYRFAESMSYLVCGTTNKSETIQGFFVKYGDGGVDIEPIAALYKTQVYQLAQYVKIMEQIINRLPSPDTFGLIATDEEFYFRMPYPVLDLLLFAWQNSVPIEKVGRVMNLTEEQVNRAFRELSNKYNVTEHLRALPPSTNFKLEELTNRHC